MRIEIQSAASPDDSVALPILQPMGSPITFDALDGFPLQGRYFEASTNIPATMAAVVVGGGGVPAACYHRFGNYLATHGVPTLTFDYRGVGKSRPLKLRGFQASAEDWSESDCGGAIRWLMARCPAAQLTGIAHSIGTFLIGGAPNVNQLSQLIFVGAHTGYYGDYLPRYRLPMAILWHGVMPILTQIVGFFPGRTLGIGDDIPAGIAMQWAARRTPDMRPEATNSNTTRTRAMLDRYSGIGLPALVLNFADDAFATEAGTRRLLAAYPALRATLRSVNPEFAGMAHIGHFGFFRRVAEPRLWPIVLDSIEALRPEENLAPAVANEA
ncbi:MAG: alpha/beta fold hydrolase [Betaproteobacteria bacterium]